MFAEVIAIKANQQLPFYGAMDHYGMLLVFFLGVFAIPQSGGSSVLLEGLVLPSLHPEINIGAMYIELTDTSRLDPLSNGTSFRKIMASLYYPLDNGSHVSCRPKPPTGDHVAHTIPYMPPQKSKFYAQSLIPYGFPDPNFSRLSSQCGLENTRPNTTSSYPLIVFSPGGGESRFLYTSILEDLARRGAIVAAIDHPYDASIVEFPNGETIVGSNQRLSKEEIGLLVSVRARDISFLIDQLGRRTLLHPRPVNVTSVVAFGHSAGGASVAEAMLHDSRITGGINMDGRLFDSLEMPNTTLSRPFIQFASEASINISSLPWDQEWQHLRGWKLELRLKGAVHQTFSDYPLLAEAYGLRAKLGKQGEQLLGSIGGRRGLEIMVEYVSAFTNFVLKGSNESLLQIGRTTKYPEVVINRSG